MALKLRADAPDAFVRGVCQKCVEIDAELEDRFGKADFKFKLKLRESPLVVTGRNACAIELATLGSGSRVLNIAMVISAASAYNSFKVVLNLSIVI